MINAVRNIARNIADDLSFYPSHWGDAQVNGAYYGPFVPNTQDPSYRNFFKSAGVGFQEAAKNYRYKIKNTDVVNPNPQPGEFSANYFPEALHLEQSVRNKNNPMWWVPYSDPFWKRIDNTAYGPWRKNDIETTKVLNELGYESDLASDAGYMAGRIVGDVFGLGTRSKTWNIHPEDLTGTIAALNFASDDNLYKFGLNPGYRDPDTDLPHYNLGIKNAVRTGAAMGLSLGSGNWTPFNIAEGGRPAGYEAVTPTEDDPRQSTQPMLDLLVSRGMLGRTSRLLPWDYFRQERPDVTYEEYQNYKDFIYNRDPGILSKATFGLLKGTPEGIDGDSPELRLLGYRVTPEGILVAAAGAAAPVALVRGLQALRK